MGSVLLTHHSAFSVEAGSSETLAASPFRRRCSSSTTPCQAYRSIRSSVEMVGVVFGNEREIYAATVRNLWSLEQPTSSFLSQGTCCCSAFPKSNGSHLS